MADSETDEMRAAAGGDDVNKLQIASDAGQADSGDAKGAPPALAADPVDVAVGIDKALAPV